MKRLLLICSTALALAPVASAARPATTAGTLQLSSCASPCVMNVDSVTGATHLDVTFTGTGYNPRLSYAGCMSGPYLDWCFGISPLHVSADGTLTTGAGLAKVGDYTFQVFQQTNKGLVPVSPVVSFTLILPAS